MNIKLECDDDGVVVSTTLKIDSLETEQELQEVFLASGYPDLGKIILNLFFKPGETISKAIPIHAFFGNFYRYLTINIL